MKAVILAAGEGSRIGAERRGIPKPLIRLLGLSLIERVICTVRDQGIRDFVVVLGYRAKQIMTHLGKGERLGVNIQYALSNQWREGNGSSLLAARDYVSGRFLLLMADHLFDGRIIHRLLQSEPGEGETLLIVDSAPRGYIDMNDATRVEIQERKIRRLGKGMERYDAVDTGIFLCDDNIFVHLERAISLGDCSLTGGMNELARKGLLRPLDATGLFWIDIDTDPALKRAEKELLRRLRKDTDGPVSRLLNRPLSTMISRKIVNTSLSPNTLTLLTFGLALSSALLFASGRYFFTALGGLMAQFSSIIDGCDGEVARLRHQSTTFGGWLDSVLDRYADGLIITGMAWGIWQVREGPDVWILASFALMGSLIASYTAVRYDRVISERMIRWRFGRDVRLLIIMLGALMNELYSILLLLAVITNLVSLGRIIRMHGMQAEASA